jgi:GrpB-like predicted nucleotidyltransferase (UPF0157 family)
MGWVTQVEHIGSTSISGMVARPIIDILAGVSSDSENENGLGNAADLVQGLNYRPVAAPAWANASIVLDKPRHGEPTHRIFLMTIGDRAWKHAVGIRDMLREKPEFAIRFEETKIARWRAGEGDPERYAADKSIFFTHLIDQLEAG